MILRRVCPIFLAALGACGSVPPVVGGSVSAPASGPVTTTPLDFARLEQEVSSELNAARSNPASYASNVSALLGHFDGTVLQMPGGPRIRTVEGAAAVREAVDALGRQAPVQRVSLSAKLSLAPRDLVRDQARTGDVGHQSSDGATMEMRVNRYGTWQRTISENIAYGTFTSGRDVVINLIVDDGVAGRGHRKNVFDPNITVIGVACGRHPRFGMSCVIDQAGGFVAK